MIDHRMLYREGNRLIDDPEPKPPQNRDMVTLVGLCFGLLNLSKFWTIDIIKKCNYKQHD